MEALAEGDGVSTLALRTAAALRELGQPGSILARFVAPSLDDEAAPRHEVLAHPEWALLFHYWNFNTSTWMVHVVEGRKAIYYHNITPPHFFRPGSSLRQMTLAGYSQISRLADCFDLVVGSSRYNAAQVCRFLHRPRPVLHIYPVVEVDECHRGPVDGALLTRLRASGETNLVFVGRVVPNKRQDLLLGLFDRYRRLDPRARLFLVGSDNADPEYRTELERRRADSPSGAHVTFTGKVTDAALNAYMRAADAFVCASEHEGFCIPIAEAMAFDVPVVARAEAAVPETLGGSGFLARDWDEDQLAEVVHALVKDRALRARTIAEQRCALPRFSAREARARLAAVVAYLESGTASPYFEWSNELAPLADEPALAEVSA